MGIAIRGDRIVVTNFVRTTTIRVADLKHVAFRRYGFAGYKRLTLYTYSGHSIPAKGVTYSAQFSDHDHAEYHNQVNEFFADIIDPS